jgi:starch synthase (maltosyl-transferring)
VIGRLPILDISPDNDLGPVKAVPGERFTVSATVIREGHDSLAAGVVLHSPEGRREALVRMREKAPGTFQRPKAVSLTDM